MGSDLLDFCQDRLYRRNTAPLGTPAERDTGKREGQTSSERERIRRWNVRCVSCASQRDPAQGVRVFCPAELDRRFKP